MDYKRLGTLQNDKIVKGTIEKQVSDIEIVMANFYQTIDDIEIKKTIYENMTEIKANLLGEGLNVSLLLNRVNILFDTFSEYTIKGFCNTDMGMKQTGQLIGLILQLEDILKESGIDTESFDSLDSGYARHYKSDIHKIIYSK